MGDNRNLPECFTVRDVAAHMASRRIDFGEGKGNKRRAVVPINETLFAELRVAKERAASPYVIEFGGHRITDIRTGLEAAGKRASLDHIHPHLFRHTAVSWSVMSGVPIAQAARMFGMTEAMVERVYGKHSPDYLRRASSALNVDLCGNAEGNRKPRRFSLRSNENIQKLPALPDKTGGPTGGNQRD